MSIDWTTVAAKCSGFSSLSATKDPGTGQILDTVFAGLRVKLSEVMAGFPSGGASGLAIFVDSLVIDAPTFDARGTTILARTIDVSQLQGSALPIATPTGDTKVLEFIVGSTTGGTLALTPVSKTPPPAYVVPCGQMPLQTVYYTVGTDGKITTNVTSAVADLADMITRPWALTAFQAGFTGASLLGDSDDLESQQTAAQMLQWIVDCIRTVSVAGIAVPGSFTDIYRQAAALLVTLNVAPGAYYVPVLTSGFYKAQTDALLGALQSYENNLNTLAVRTDISQAVKDVSDTLANVSKTEMDPLNTELTQVQDNIAGLATAIGTLSDQYFYQQIEVRSKYALLANAIAQQRIQDWLSACFSLATSTAALAVSVGKLAAAKPDASGLGDSVKGFALAAKGFYDAADALASDSGLDMSMVDQARQLMQVQQALVTSFQSGAILWAQTLKSATAPDLPKELSAVSIDPGLAWDNYMVRARLSMETLKRDNGSGVQQPADEYLASLEILSQYGKAINAKMITYAAQLARGVVLKSQIEAATTIMSQWRELEAKATSDQEKLAALRGVILLRSNSIKRTMIVSWTYYRNSYFYLYFQKPPFTINMDMNAAQLKDSFASVAGWVGQLLGDDPGKQKITLPSSNVRISLTFPIVKSGQELASGSSALFTPGAGSSTLTWTLPTGTDQLAEVLPDSGDVAIWITSANFFLEGVTPNAKGNVLLRVSTSGSYQNGFGPGKSFNFVTKGLVKDYAYHLPDATVYNPWVIDSQVYQMPAPFTQWTAEFSAANGGDISTATRLRMDLVVSYRTNGNS